MALTRTVSDYKDSVKAATVGANINLAAAPNTLDGVALSANDRVLVKDQTPSSLNGIYRISTLGTGSNGTWVRASDFNDYRQISSGVLTFVEQGTISGNIFYYIPGGEPNVTVGSTSITFSNLFSFLETTNTLQTVTNAGNNTTNIISISNTAISSSTTSGALQVSGGIGIGGNAYIGGNIVVSGNIIPSTSNVYTLGTFTNRFANLYLKGNTIVLGSVLLQDVNGSLAVYDINGNQLPFNSSAINNTPIGNSVPSTGVFTTVNSTGQVIGYLNGVLGANTPNTVVATSITTISGGQISGYLTGAIGANIANSGAFTTVAASGALSAASITASSGGQVSGYLTGAIGANTPNSVVATSITTISGGQISGYLTGAIGANIANSGAFTAVNVSGALTAASLTATNGGQINGYLNGALGANIPNSVIATSVITSSGGQVSGYLTGAIGANVANTGTFTSASITNATNTTGLGTGAFIVNNGGAAIQQDLYVGGNIYAANIISQTSQTLVVSDPLLYLSGPAPGTYNYEIGFYSHFVGGNIPQYGHTGLVRNHVDNQWYLFSNLPEPSGGTVNLSNVNIVYDTLKFGAALIQNTTTSTSTTSGALQVSGGVGIAGALYANNFNAISLYAGTIGNTGATLTGTLSTASQTNITSVGTLTGLTVSGPTNLQGTTNGATINATNLYATTIGNTGAAINGNLINASALYAGTIGNSGASLFGTISTAAQTNITSLGTLTGLTVSGTTNLQGTTNGATINASTLLATAIGNTNTVYTGGAGTFTSLTTSSGGQHIGYLTGAIGANTANSGAFTTLTTTGNLYGGGNIIAASGTTSISTTTGALVVNGGVGVSGNAYVGGNIAVGSALNYVPLNGILQIGGNQNNYIQVALQNTNSGTNASADIAVVANNGSDNDTFIDMGITSSTYSQTAYNLYGANDGYLVVSGNTTTQGGNLIINTYSTKDIVFATGGTLISNEIGRFRANTNSFIVSSTTNSTGITTGAMQVRGGAGISGNLYVGSNIYIGGTAVGRFYSGNTAPSGPNLGDTWYQGNTDVLFEYIQDAANNKFWLDLTSNPSSYGNLTVANTLTLNGTTNNNGTANLGAISQVIITGGTAGYVLQTNGSGGLSWVAVSATAGGANTNIQFNDGGSINGATYISYNKITGNLYSTSPTVSTSTTTGAITTPSMGISGNLYVGNIVTTSGIFYPNGATAGGGAGGANTMVQFNDGATISGSTYLQYNKTSGNLVSNSTTTSTSTTTGALVVQGGVGIAGNLYVGGNLSIAGNTTFINTTTISTTDTIAAPIINANVVGNVGSSLYGTIATNAQPFITSVGTLTGLTVSGTTNLQGTTNGATINATSVLATILGNTNTVLYGATSSATTAFLPTANNAVSLANATNYMSSIYGVNYFVANALAPIANAVASFGTSTAMPLNDYAVNYNVANSIIPIANTTASIGTAQRTFQNIYAVSFTGTSTTAKYADLAEMYQADDYYAPGTVMIFGGDSDVTISTISHDTAIAGVVSTNPAYLMNDNYEDGNWLPIALTGRVPCRVRGPVNKGTLLVSSDERGVAMAMDKSLYEPGCVIGKSMDVILDNSIKKIEIAVGRF